MGETRRLTLREAAETAGMPLDALRKRVYRGTIKATKVDGQYLIDPDDLAPLREPGETPSDIGETTGETVLGCVSGKGETPFQAPELTLDYIESLKGEISFLRDQLDQRSRELASERERSDVLHREAFARIEALTAGLSSVSDDAPDDGADDDRETTRIHPDKSDDAEHLERVRAYLDDAAKTRKSPQDRDIAPGRAEATSLTPDSNTGAPAAPRSVFGDLWAWVRGR